MELKIDPAQIQSAIQDHLDRVVKDGIDYRVKEQLNKAIADAITPEIVAGYAAAAVKALTDPTVTQRIVQEMHNAIAEGAREAMQEAVVSVVARIRGIRIIDDPKVQEIRQRLFPK